MAIQLTSAARERVAFLKTQPDATGDWLRIGIRGGGCSGFSYVLDWIAKPAETDKQFEFDGDVKVCVDKKSYTFLNGIEMDFEVNPARTGFVFRNPNATSTCSCGESFTV
jgi:iron-sulfur cluster assembly protein